MQDTWPRFHELWKESDSDEATALIRRIAEVIPGAPVGIAVLALSRMLAYGIAFESENMPELLRNVDDCREYVGFHAEQAFRYQNKR